ncbi:hypothetical protein DEO72_LG7g3121 [Vigna unguiculata]|uniref:Uncharacterized protein n=1 Tax=Vigna unguiculata TaxID=3917 RepID=A0A4D6MMA1_VIGUN|nr:hypothetical protein DEO72_LG7g3121 [Vigna unguiculata]
MLHVCHYWLLVVVASLPCFSSVLKGPKLHAPGSCLLVAQRSMLLRPRYSSFLDALASSLHIDCLFWLFAALASSLLLPLCSSLIVVGGSSLLLPPHSTSPPLLLPPHCFSLFFSRSLLFSSLMAPVSLLLLAHRCWWLVAPPASSFHVTPATPASSLLSPVSSFHR